MKEFQVIILLLSLLKMTAGQKLIINKGDINIAGLFQVYDTEYGKCHNPRASHVQLLEAVKWTLDLLNSHNYIPDTKLGLMVLPTCGLTSEANNRTFELITEMRIQAYNLTSDRNNYGPVAAVLGPPYSEEVKTTSQILSSLPDNERFPQIGYSATAATIMNKAIYKNFLSVISSDDIQVKVMISLIKKLEWNYIAILYEDDLYGKQGASNLEKLAFENGICVAVSNPIKVNRKQHVSAEELNKLIKTLIYDGIKGAVFFGNDFVANLLLQSVEKSGFTEKITFIFSEGIGLKDKIFYEENHIIEKGKGSFVVSPPDIKARGFYFHWTNIFNNTANLLKESKSNPLLMEVFKQYTNCYPETQKCSPIPLSEREIYGCSVYAGYAIKATLLLANVLKDIHNETCIHNPNIFCSEFSDLILRSKNKILSRLMKTIHTFNDNFPDTLKKIFAEPLDYLVQNISLPAYEVYQFGNCSDKSRGFCLNRMGQYMENRLHLSENLAVVPAVAECRNGTRCSKCLPASPKDLIYFEEGDIYVVGVVPVYHKVNEDPTGCDNIKTAHSVELAEVMAYAVKECNYNTNCFLGKRVGLIILNSCNQRLVIQRKILDLLNKGVPRVNGSYVNVTNRIAGFIGGFSSTVTIAMADILSELGYVQISYAGTSTVLTDRKKYPYFLRVVPPNNNEAIAIIKILKELENSNYVQVIYSEGAFGESCNAAFKAEAKKHNICIANETPVFEDKYSSILQKLRQHSYAKIVVAFLQSYMAVGVSAELQQNMEQGEFIIIGSQALGQTPEIIANNDKLVGSFTLSFGMKDILGFNDYLNSINLDDHQRNPWLKNYVETKYKCYLKGSFNKIAGRRCSNKIPEMTRSYNQEQWTPYAYSAMVAFLQGANKTFHKRCGMNIDGLCQLFKPNELWGAIKQENIYIHGEDKYMSLFDQNGDGNAAYTIYNVQRNKIYPLHLEYVKVGQTYPNESGMNFVLMKTQLQYAENLLLPSTCTNDLCYKCFGAQAKYQPDDTVKVLIGGVVVLCFIIVILILIITFRLKAHKAEKTENGADEIYIHPSTDTEQYDRLPDIAKYHETNRTKDPDNTCNIEQTVRTRDNVLGTA